MPCGLVKIRVPDEVQEPAYRAHLGLVLVRLTLGLAEKDITEPTQCVAEEKMEEVEEEKEEKKEER